MSPLPTLLYEARWVYAATREQGMSAEERLVFHQEHSKPVMEKLHTWLQAQFDERLVEPNSGLGNVINYLLKHYGRNSPYFCGRLASRWTITWSSAR